MTSSRKTDSETGISAIAWSDTKPMYGCPAESEDVAMNRVSKRGIINLYEQGQTEYLKRLQGD